MKRPESLEHMGNDLLLTPFYAADSWGTLDLTLNPAVPVYPDDTVDLDVARGGDSLRQALLLRLLTAKGSLKELGHNEYGSRLHEIIGCENNETNRLRARSFVLQAISQEKRVACVLELRVLPDAALADRIHINLQVLPIDSKDPLSLGIEVDL